MTGVHALVTNAIFKRLLKLKLFQRKGPLQRKHRGLIRKNRHSLEFVRFWSQSTSMQIRYIGNFVNLSESPSFVPGLRQSETLQIPSMV